MNDNMTSPLDYHVHNNKTCNAQSQLYHVTEINTQVWGLPTPTHTHTNRKCGSSLRTITVQALQPAQAHG